jgi:hypothetical protein
VGVYTPKNQSKLQYFAGLKDKIPVRRILLLKLGIQIRALRARNLSGPRRLSTGFFACPAFAFTKAGRTAYQHTKPMQELFCFFCRQ